MTEPQPYTIKPWDVVCMPVRKSLTFLINSEVLFSEPSKIAFLLSRC